MFFLFSHSLVLNAFTNNRDLITITYMLGSCLRTSFYKRKTFHLNFYTSVHIACVTLLDFDAATVLFAAYEMKLQLLAIHVLCLVWNDNKIAPNSTFHYRTAYNIVVRLFQWVLTATSFEQRMETIDVFLMIVCFRVALK